MLTYLPASSIKWFCPLQSGTGADGRLGGGIGNECVEVAAESGGGGGERGGGAGASAYIICKEPLLLVLLVQMLVQVLVQVLLRVLLREYGRKGRGDVSKAEMKVEEVALEQALMLNIGTYSSNNNTFHFHSQP
ncbi:unnamed protein product [Strongylus vulgaris]|uniref:Uncharacterized protein n=1 Tax=Strongylus vulgaris TaxID=40348 RepID=A0A3P7IX98_STRVU|nr:unnamed protein product [Strongylus vulgaris]